MGYQEMVTFSDRFDSLIADMMTQVYFEDMMMVMADRLGECLRIHQSKHELYDLLRSVIEERARLKES